VTRAAAVAAAVVLVGCQPAPAVAWVAAQIEFAQVGEPSFAAVAWSNGVFVIGGAYFVVPPGDADNFSGRAAAWSSADGRVWAEVAPDQFGVADANSRLTHVAARGGGFIAAGEQWTTPDSDRTALLWISDDGRRWTSVGAEQLDADSPAGTPLALWSAGDEGFLATSGRERAPSAAVWSISREGEVEAVRSIGEAVVDAASDGRASVVVTESGSDPESTVVRTHVFRAGEWTTSEVEELQRPPTAITASAAGFLLATHGTPPFLRSADGLDWTGPTGPPLGEGDRITDVAEAESRAIAVGFEFVDLNLDARTGAVWMSADGGRWWRATETLGVIRETSRDTELTAVAMGTDTVVAIGQAGPRRADEVAAAWYLPMSDSAWLPPAGGEIP
jgi:hypothetical protein